MTVRLGVLFLAVAPWLQASEAGPGHGGGSLDFVGFCCYKNGDTKEALEVLKASLRLNPEQDQVKSLIAAMEQEK